MKVAFNYPILRLLTVVFATILLSACAGEIAHRQGLSLLADGKTEEGVAKLETAAKDAPSNIEFRLSYENARDSLVNRWLASGNTERAAGRLDEAESQYKKIFKISPGNSQAVAGLAAVEQARRHLLLLKEAGALLDANDLDGAEAKIRQILQENTQHTDARLFLRQIEEKGGRGQLVSQALRRTFKKPVNLEFRDANLKQVIEALSRYSGINFILDKDIPASLQTTVFLRQVSVEDALDIILSTLQLSRHIVSDNTLLIYPNTAAKQSEYQDLIVKSFYLVNADAKQAMNLLKSVLKVKNVYVDEKLNLLVMRDTPEAVRLAERLVAMQDVREPEVMLEVEVIEVKRTRLTELGIRYPDQLILTPLASNGSTLTLNDLKTINADRIGATIASPTINLRREVGDANILANPRIRTRNREKALIKIGDRVPVITTTATSTGFVSESVQYLDVGLKVEVEPTIYPDNEVAIKVNLEVSTVVREVKSASGSLTYQIGSRNASTVLRLKDGETQVLGGLISDEERKTANRVPGLGDIPILGRLFASQRDDNQKTELILSITPRLISGIVPPGHVPNEFWSGTENNLRLKPLSVTSAIPTERAPVDSGAKAIAAPPQPMLAAESQEPPAMLRWDGQTQAKVGASLTLSVKVSSPQALSGLPLQIKYDPAVLEVVDVKAGGYMGQGDAKIEFANKVVAASGMVFVTNNRLASEGAKGDGDLLTIEFKALKPTERSIVTILPATPLGKNKSPLRQTGPALIGIGVVP